MAHPDVSQVVTAQTIGDPRNAVQPSCGCIFHRSQMANFFIYSFNAYSWCE